MKSPQDPFVMSNKRPLDEGGGDTPSKAPKFSEPFQIGTVYALDELDNKVLQFQNNKIYQRLKQHKRTEDELRVRIEQLEKRQVHSDDVLTIVNRYWTQFNEDIDLMLQRYDDQSVDDANPDNDSESTSSFLTQLSTWDKEELNEKLENRVEASRKTVSRVLLTFEKLNQRNLKVTKALNADSAEGEPKFSVDEAVKSFNGELQKENSSLQSQNLKLHENHRLMSLKNKELEEKVQAMDTEHAEMQNRLEDMEYDVNKTHVRSQKLEDNLTEVRHRLKLHLESGGTTSVKVEKPVVPATAVPTKEIEDLTSDLEEQRELAVKRLEELEKKTNEFKDTLKEVEGLKMELKQLPEGIIVETTEYKCLQSQFSVLYNESMQLKTQLEETRHQLQTSKNAHLRQIEQMESEELLCQRKLRTEVIQLEDMLAQVRKEYEMLRIEFEQNLAANEQTGPINREMRHLITSLQNHIQQLKGEIQRYRRKCKDSAVEAQKYKKDVEDMQQKLSLRMRSGGVAVERHDSTSSEKGEISKELNKEEGGETYDSCLSTGTDQLADNGDDKTADGSDVKKEDNDDDKCEDGDKKDDKIRKDLKKEKDAKEAMQCVIRDSKENELIKSLKSELKKAHAEARELKLLLDMYKAQGVGKEQRDKVQLMVAEKKARQEVEDLKTQVKKLQDSKREERKKLADEEAIRKIKHLEDSVHQFQRHVSAQKLEEEALINEMEVTGQAFEETQDQNVRLIQQLREKDNANFKLMSERIKSNQINKLANEERDNLSEQVSALSTQGDAQNQVVRKLEEKERLLQNTLSTVERELQLRQQALEMHKRKAIESAQSAADLKLHLEKYHSQMKEAQQVVGEKTQSMELESFKHKRIQEEICSLRRKVERAKKFETADKADEVLIEEIKEYKDILTCPSCKVKKKDALLVKCFHVFCFDCLRTRYETRQRKCPKCNAAFGANDYHRLYLT